MSSSTWISLITLFVVLVIISAIIIRVAAWALHRVAYEISKGIKEGKRDDS